MNKNTPCEFFSGKDNMCTVKENKCNPTKCELYTKDKLATILELKSQLLEKEQEILDEHKVLCEIKWSLQWRVLELLEQKNKYIELIKLIKNEIFVKNIPISTELALELLKEIDNVLEEGK